MLNVPWPKLVAPSAKVTTPVGVPVPLIVTVAVKVSACPATEGLTDVTSAVLLVALPTVWVSAPLLLVKLLSPA